MFASRINPIRRLRLASLAIMAGGLVSLVTIAMLLWPTRDLPEVAQADLNVPPPRETLADDGEDEPDYSPIEESLFTARLWNPPPPPPPEDDADHEADPDPEPPRPPSNIELIAITSNGTQRIAAIFDADANKLRNLHTGDELKGFTITKIDEAHVTLTVGQTTHRLELITAAGLPDRTSDTASGRSPRRRPRGAR